MSNFTNSELTDIVLIYGETGQNGEAARRLYQERIVTVVYNYSSRQMTCDDSIVKTMTAQEGFNNQLFTNIFKRYNNDDTLKIEDFKFSRACQPGENFTCDVQRVSCEGRRKIDEQFKVYKTSLVLKRIPRNDKHAEMYRSKIALVNEANAYNKIIPVLKKYAVDGSLAVADCLQADENQVMLQDLSLGDYQTVNRMDGGLTLEQCRTVVLALANLHAASMVLREKEPQTLKDLSQLTTETMFTGGEELLKSQKTYIEYALKMFTSSAPSAEQGKAVKFLNNLCNNFEQVSRQLLEKPKEHSVIGHGDAWVCNMMFNKKGEVKLIDLQLMRYNSVAVDLCYLFYVNLKPSLCAEHIQPLLKIYLDSLRENVRAKGVDLDNVLTQEWLDQEMSRFADYGIMRSLWVMPLFFYQPEDVKLENINEALLMDIDYMIGKVGDQYTPRMKELILNYTKNLNI